MVHRSSAVFCAALWTLMLCAPLAHAGEDYFLLMFGSQRTPNVPDYTHSFATFVRARWPGDGPCAELVELEPLTISWNAATGEVRTYALFPEQGRNVGLHESIQWCLKNDMRVSLWGAYRIDAELYCRAKKQASVLESGRVRYKANDSLRSSRRVSNCIHALSSVVEGRRLRIASPGWGEVASYAVLLRYRRHILDTETTHPWVGSALGLDQYPIIYREWEHPRSGILGAFFRFFGFERNLKATYGPPSQPHLPTEDFETAEEATIEEELQPAHRDRVATDVGSPTEPIDGLTP